MGTVSQRFGDEMFKFAPPARNELSATDLLLRLVEELETRLDEKNSGDRSAAPPVECVDRATALQRTSANNPLIIGRTRSAFSAGFVPLYPPLLPSRMLLGSWFATGSLERSGASGARQPFLSLFFSCFTTKYWTGGSVIATFTGKEKEQSGHHANF